MNLETIAEKAGVSRSTVSRVINNEPYVSEKTRERVMQVIEQEGFVPNPAARMLVTQRTQVIGVIFPRNAIKLFEDRYFYPTLLEGVTEVTNALDYSMLLWMKDAVNDENRFYQRVLKNRLMDGLIVVSPTTDNNHFLSELLAAGTQFVMVERPDVHTDQISYVTVDNIEATITAMNHLINLGRQRISTITGALDNVDGIDRLKGYRKALEHSAIDLDENLIYEGDFSQNSGYRGMKQLLKHDVDAVFASNVPTAIGAMNAIAEAGLRIPEDIAIIGFDDLPSTLETKPPLTTVRQPIREKAILATRMLINQIEGNTKSPQQVLLPTQLVIRESCGAMRQMARD